MTRLALFFTPALFVAFAAGAYLAQEHERDPLCLALMVAALVMLAVWFVAVRFFEVSAWQAGRGNRPL